MCYKVPFTFIQTFHFFSIRFVSSAKFSSMSNSQCWSTFSTWHLSPLSLPNPPYLLMLKRPLDCYLHSTTSPFVLRHCDYKQQAFRLNINKIVRISSVFIDSFGQSENIIQNVSLSLWTVLLFTTDMNGLWYVHFVQCVTKKKTYVHVLNLAQRQEKSHVHFLLWQCFTHNL